MHVSIRGLSSVNGVASSWWRWREGGWSDKISALKEQLPPGRAMRCAHTTRPPREGRGAQPGGWGRGKPGIQEASSLSTLSSVRRNHGAVVSSTHTQSVLNSIMRSMCLTCSKCTAFQEKSWRRTTRKPPSFLCLASIFPLKVVRVTQSLLNHLWLPGTDSK